MCSWAHGQRTLLLAAYCYAQPRHVRSLQTNSDVAPFMNTVDVLNLATGDWSPGPKLPEGGQDGCAAFDSTSCYVYYVHGDGSDGSSDGFVYRIKGEPLGLVSLDTMITLTQVSMFLELSCDTTLNCGQWHLYHFF